MPIVITVCAWCPKPKVYKTAYAPDWRPFTPEVLRSIQSGTVRLQHGVCPQCFTREMREIEQPQNTGGGL